MKKILILIFAVLCLTCCSKDEPEKKEEVNPIIGTWELSQVSTKAVTYGSTQVSVYLIFEKAGTFTIYQKVGDGRYKCYSGTYTYANGVLNGTYSDSKAWASSYEASFEGNKMTLTQSSGTEKDIYVKSSIPANLINSL